MSYLSLVNLLNFLINCFEATPFLSQYRTSIKITGSLTSKKPGGVIKSIILWSFSLFRKSLHALSLNFDGKSAAMNFFLIFCSKPVAILFARCNSPLIAFLLLRLEMFEDQGTINLFGFLLTCFSIFHLN